MRTLSENRAHRTLASCALLAVFVLVSAGSARAQSGELWFDAGASLLDSGLGGATPDDFHFTDGFRFGFRFAFNTHEYMGHEIQYAYSRTHLKSDSLDEDFGGMAVHEGGYNFLLYARPMDSRIRPFGTVGVEFANYVPPGSSAAYGGGSTKFGFNYGAGVKVKVTSIWAVRFDIRQYTTPKPDFGLPNLSGWIHQNEVSGGVGIYF